MELQQNKDYQLTLNGADMNIIMAALQELPFKIAAMVISKIQPQIMAQSQ